MVVQFFRLGIEGTDEAKLNTIKDWVDTQIDNNDLDENVNVNISGPLVSEVEDNSGEYRLFLDMYIKDSVSKTKYRDFIVNHFTPLNKTGLTHAFIDKYNECSHDSNNPQPCVVTRVMEWTA